MDQSAPGGVDPVHSEGLGGVTLSQDTTGARVSLRQISQHQNENDYRNPPRIMEYVFNHPSLNENRFVELYPNSQYYINIW